MVAGLSRVIRDEVESAAAVLSDAKKTGLDDAIFEARKSIKKARAALRLLHAGTGARTARRENARLREIAGRLAGFRDAFAAIETFDMLKKKYAASGLGSGA